MPSPSRIAPLAQALSNANIDVALLSSANMMGYAHGFFEDAHERLMLLAIRADGQCCLIAPALSGEQARRQGIQEVRTWKDGESGLALFQQLADEWEMRTSVIAVDNEMRADILLQIQAAVPSAMFHPSDALFGPVMARKDAEEIRKLEAAAAIVEKVYEAILPTLKPGLTEAQIAGRLQGMVLERGASLNFCIVATGAASAEPHHLSDNSVVKPGDVLLMDFGCQLDHYQADITRVVSMGPASAKVHEVYGIVRSAYLGAKAAVKPGATGAEVDQGARKVIEAAGYGDYFTHRTGHGIGIRGHEAPNMSPDNDMPLEPGNTFSIEPGIYLPGDFGIRLENIFACGEQDAHAINKKEFEERILEL